MLELNEGRTSVSTPAYSKKGTCFEWRRSQLSAERKESDLSRVRISEFLSYPNLMKPGQVSDKKVLDGVKIANQTSVRRY